MAKQAFHACFVRERPQTVDKPSSGKNASICGQRASQSFPAHRRENKVRIIKIPGHVPGILNFDRASVCLWHARSPMQILLRSKPALIESVSKSLFRHAEAFHACSVRERPDLLRNSQPPEFSHAPPSCEGAGPHGPSGGAVPPAFPLPPEFSDAGLWRRRSRRRTAAPGKTPSPHRY